MKTKVLKRSAILLLAGSTMAAAATYTWDGGSTDTWNNRYDWDCTFCGASGYPSTTNDDAIIAKNDTIDVTDDETFDDLSIGNPGSNGGPTLTGDGSVVTLTCDMVSIAGGGSHYTEVTVTGKCVIATN